MNRKVITFLYMLLAALPLAGQGNVWKPVVNQAEIEAFKSALTKETTKIQDIRADFVQTKKMEFLNEAVVSTGALYFATGKRLRWEYEKPYSFVFILNGTKAWMINQGGTTEMDVQSNKMFKELSELMMFGIGGASLFDNRNFDFTFRCSGRQWEVGLKPKTKEMKALYTQIELLFDAQSYQMELVRMMETSGDETQIVLKNHKINTPLQDALFEGKK
jgi:outer membrane lipoprotein-sorting protein